MKQLNGIKGNSCLLKEEALKCKISFGLSDTICKQTATKHLKRLQNYCYVVSIISNKFGNETKNNLPKYNIQPKLSFEYHKHP